MSLIKPQTESIIPLHSSFFVHMASKWKHQDRGLLMARGLEMKRAQWFEVESTKWWTLTSPNFSIQSHVAKALSNLKYTLSVPLLHIAPHVVQSIKAQVFESTGVDGISKTLHLTL